MPKKKALREQLTKICALIKLVPEPADSSELLEKLVDLSREYPDDAELARVIAEETAA